MKLKQLLRACALLGVAAACGAALADEASLRKNLAERLPNLPKIEEVTPAPIPGLFEIRVNGSEIYYSDGEGNFLINGSLLDTKAGKDLTEERINKLTAVAFDALPVKDAFTIVRGNGRRKLAVFEDPNCGYCKMFERNLSKIDNVTIHLFLIPILSPDSAVKSRGVWCAKDKAKTWQDWMVRDTAIPNLPATAACDDSALERNLAFSRKYRITGTPTLIFANGNRVPGAIGQAQIEKYLADAGS